ncbi:MAG: sugar nucleotide-binding protein [Candidatus Micrarchaeota archaeon]
MVFIRILVIGATGVVGFHLAQQLEGRHEVITAARSSKNVDYNADALDKTQLVSLIENAKPDVIANAIKPPMSTDAMEKDRAQAYAVNTALPETLARLQSRFGFKLVQFSTDWVYEGLEGVIYTELSPVKPKNYYSFTKAQCEEKIAALSDNYLILRTEGVFGFDERGANLFLRLKSAAKDGKEVLLPADQYSQPISGKELARITAMLIDNGEKGIFNAVGRDYLSRFEFGERVCSVIGWKCNLRKSSIKDKPLPVPACLRVSVEKVEKAVGTKIMSIDEQIAELMVFA